MKSLGPNWLNDVQYAPQSNFRKHDNLGRIQRDHDYTQKWKSRDPRETDRVSV